MVMEKELITAIFLGIGLSASCGLRIFVPLLVASIAARLGYLPVSESFEWLKSGAAIACFSVATITEVLAYYIPFVDNLLDSIAIPLAIGAGTLLASSVLPVEEELWKWVLGFIVGGSTASVFQGTTSLSRLASSSMTAGVGNPIITTGENTAAFVLPILIILSPVIVGTLVLVAMLFLVKRIFKKRKSVGS